MAVTDTERIGRRLQRIVEQVFAHSLTQIPTSLTKFATVNTAGENSLSAGQLAKARAEVARLQIELDRFRNALDHLPVGLSMFDGLHRLIACNAVYREIYGLPEDLCRAGTPFDQLMLHYVKREGLTRDGDALEMVSRWTDDHYSKIATGKSFVDVQTLSNGQVVSLHVGPTAEGGWVDVLEDVTLQRSQEAKIAHMALHDAVTGLPNRVQLREHLKRVIEGVRSTDTVVAVHFLDLDRFKGVNDTLGHAAGDALLSQVAHRLKTCLREF